MEISGPKQVKVHILDVIRVKDTAPYFQQEKGVVAYVGTEGISVALLDFADFEDYVSLRWGEFDVVESSG